MIGAASAPAGASGPAASASRGAMRGDAPPRLEVEAAPAATGGTAASGPEPAGRQTGAAEEAGMAAEQAFAGLLLQPQPQPPAPPPPPQRGDLPADAGTVSPQQLLALLDGARSGAATDRGLLAGGVAGPGDAQGAPMQRMTPEALSGSSQTLQLPAEAARAAGFAASTGASLAAEAGAAFSLAAAWVEADAASGSRDALAMSPPDAGIDAVGGTFAASTPAAARAQAAPPPLPPLPMPAEPAGGFDDGFGTRLVWMAEQRLGHAEIRLNPEHMGPIDVRVELDGEQVRAEFHSAHAEVRQAIEASLPRLRELLGQHGLQLGQADVGQGQAGRGGAGSRPGDAAMRGDGGESDIPGPASTTTTPLQTRGLLDEYA